jgi:hypothetical protein
VEDDDLGVVVDLEVVVAAADLVKGVEGVDAEEIFNFALLEEGFEGDGAVDGALGSSRGGFEWNVEMPGTAAVEEEAGVTTMDDSAVLGS